MQSQPVNQFPNEQSKRRILPPQVDEQITFGIMWMRVGKLKLTASRKGPLQNKFIVQFWGQKQPLYLQTKSNPLNHNEANTMAQYDIKCPVTYFKEYLLDMKKNLRIEVQDLGKIDFDITKFLKPHVDLSSRYVFDHFKGSFEIVGKHNRKIGSIELQMACNFNPELAALQIGDQEDGQEIVQKTVPKQKIRSPGVDKDMAVEILAVQNPKLLNEFYEQTSMGNNKPKKPSNQELIDNRIPNSLYTQMSPQRFDPSNYLNDQPNNKNDRPAASQEASIQNRQKSMKKPESEENRIEQDGCTFPTIAKVLTYSNLRLGKQFEEAQQSSNKPNLQKNISGVNIQRIFQSKQRSSYNDERQEKSPIHKIQSKQICDIQQNQKPIFTKEKQDAFSEIKKSEISQENLLEEEEKQILSRVVNLDQELKKSQINSPAKNKKIVSDQAEFNQQRANPQVLKQNEIRPVTQYNIPQQFTQNLRHQTHQGRFAVPQPMMMKKPKPSSLVLNLLVEIQTKSITFLKKKQKFHLIHRPYGCKQRIKLGPKFESEKILIMCPVSEELVSKMDKLPFIVEFWGAVSNQFLGFFKLDLIKIKKGFMLQGRLNQIAIKSSLLPIIIQKGQISIQTVNGQRSGECTIYAAIGTTVQVQLYLNTERRIQKKQPELSINQSSKKPETTKKKKTQGQTQPVQQNKFDLSNAHLLLTNFLYFIDNNSTRNIQHLADLMKKKEVTSEQFEDFILNINPNQQKIKELVYLFRNMNPSVQQKQSKFIKTESLKLSFDQYKEIQESILKEFNQVNKIIQKRLSSQVKEEISRNSSFNIIEKKKLNLIYQNHLQKQKVLGSDKNFSKQLFNNYYLSFFDDYVNIKTIFSEEKLNSYYEPSQKIIIEKVKEHFYEILFQNHVSIEYLEIYLKETSSQQDSLSVKLAKFCKEQMHIPSNGFSLWYWLCLCQQSTESQKQLNQSADSLFISKLNQIQMLLQSFNVIKERIATQQAQLNEKKAFEQTQKRKLQQQKIVKPAGNDNKQQNIERNESASISYSNIHQILNQNDASNLSKNVLNPNNASQINQSQKYPDNILIEKENINDSNSQSNSQIDFNQKPTKYYEHFFSIKGIELFLQFPFDGQCQVNYVFPFDDEAIGSKKIKVFKNKHRYAINLFGQHKITIENDIESYMNDIPVKFELINLSGREQTSQEIMLQGDLHPDEMLLENNTVESKVVPLFGQNTQKVLGKVKLQISYQCKETQKSSLGKETVYNLFLPKSGFVNFGFQVKLQEQKIRSQYNLQGDEYYVSMVLDFFHQSKSLRPHNPPIISKLFSNLQQDIQFSNAFKLNLNPAILQYIKEKTCLISLNLIYYSKEKGNYQKKQITFATLKIPLFNLIKDEGIDGNYAFKNKYGMFVGLCKGSMKYDRYEKKERDANFQSHLGNTVISNRNKLNNYWILIHFKQLINFEPSVQTTFIRFETILNSTKFQTQRIHLSDDPLLIFNDLIAISLPQEQFMATKIIPISLIMDQNQKFAMDISLRPITKKLSKQNYFAGGGYFLVVDENSEMVKMRVGARVIAFKGNSILEPFVTSYCNNVNLDVLEQIDLQRDLENYPKLVQIFRNELKLSKKTFEECIRQIIPHKNEKLPLDLMSSQLFHRLDLTPIVAQNEEEVDSLVRNLQGTISQKALNEFTQEHEYKLTNFHSEVIAQYSFESLWSDRIDKNVEYFNLKKEIDVLTLARKIKVIDSNDKEEEKDQRKYKELRITIQQGVNFHYLYNGIKPNVLLKIPKLSYESKVKSRASEPLFNESLREIVEQQNESLYRNLEFLVYHVSTGKRGQDQEILVGEGKLNVFSHINLSHPKSEPEQKPAKVIISSTMSSKMKATLEITLKLSYLGENELHERGTHMKEDVLEDASRIEEMIKDINKEMDDKRYLFDESSDDDC